MKATEQGEFRRLFLAEFYLKTPLLQNKIKKVVYKKLGRFPEAGDIDYMVVNCISDIESILIKQLHAKPGELFNCKERKRKLALFKEDKSYLEKYILEATKSFCRKKQDYWTHGRNKADPEKGETHKAKKIGRAAREHYSGDANKINSWIDTLVSSHLSTDMLQAETIESLNYFFKEIGVNDKKIKCFWDRFNGVTFIEMAQEDPA